MVIFLDFPFDFHSPLPLEKGYGKQKGNWQLIQKGTWPHVLISWYTGNCMSPLQYGLSYSFKDKMQNSNKKIKGKNC